MHASDSDCRVIVNYKSQVYRDSHEEHQRCQRHQEQLLRLARTHDVFQQPTLELQCLPKPATSTKSTHGEHESNVQKLSNVVQIKAKEGEEVAQSQCEC